MKKLKIISSVILSSLLTTGAVFAWVNLSNVGSGDTLTSSIWNSMIAKINENGNKLEGIYNVGGKIGIGISNPTENLDINGNIKITGNGKTVTISADSWNEIQKNLNKAGYAFSTWNNTDLRHTRYGQGTNFRNCETVEYFQLGETIQNTEVYEILYNYFGTDRTTWNTNVNYAKLLRDFTLDPSRSDPSDYRFAAWMTLKYGPAKLQSCAID